jgi:hypothetical protein
MDVHKLEGVPDALDILLQAGEVGVDVAGSLLLALAVCVDLLLVPQHHLALEDQSSLQEGLIVALGCVGRIRPGGYVS